MWKSNDTYDLDVHERLDFLFSSRDFTRIFARVVHVKFVNDEFICRLFRFWWYRVPVFGPREDHVRADGSTDIAQQMQPTANCQVTTAVRCYVHIVDAWTRQHKTSHMNNIYKLI